MKTVIPLAEASRQLSLAKHEKLSQVLIRRAKSFCGTEPAGRLVEIS